MCFLFSVSLTILSLGGVVVNSLRKDVVIRLATSFWASTRSIFALPRPAAHGSKAHDVVNSKVLLLFARWDTMAGMPSSRLQRWQTLLLPQDPLTLQCKWRNSSMDKHF